MRSSSAWPKPYAVTWPSAAQLLARRGGAESERDLALNLDRVPARLGIGNQQQTAAQVIERSAINGDTRDDLAGVVQDVGELGIAARIARRRSLESPTRPGHVGQQEQVVVHAAGWWQLFLGTIEERHTIRPGAIHVVADPLVLAVAHDVGVIGGVV